MYLKLSTAALLLLAACDSPGGGNAAGGNATAIAQPEAEAQPEKVLKSETVEAVFKGWEVGDYVWANLAIKGRETAGAFVGPTPLEHFLEAHKGKPITVRIDTVRMMLPAAGSEEEVQKIADARAGQLTVAQWWAGLTAEQRQAAERRMEEVLGGGV